MVDLANDEDLECIFEKEFQVVTSRRRNTKTKSKFVSNTKPNLVIQICPYEESLLEYNRSFKKLFYVGP